MKRAMGGGGFKRKRYYLLTFEPTSGNYYLQLLGLAVIVAAVSCGPDIGVRAFGPPQTASSRSLHSLTITAQTRQITHRQNRLTAQGLSNNDNNDGTFFELGLLSRRFERADKTEILNDATLVACYVLCRFLIYDIASGTKIAPGWEPQDWIWLTGTFSSATVLVVYYAIAGLLSRTYETNSAYAAESPVLRAVVNVVLCCPVWLATEHLLEFGPADIGGDSLAATVTTGIGSFGSFMALAKTLTVGMR